MRSNGVEKRLMHKFHSVCFYCSCNLFFRQNISAELTGYSCHCVFIYHPYLLSAYLDTNEDLDDIDDEENEALEDDLPPEVPKRTSSKGVGSVPLASSTSASGRSSAGSLSIRGQVKSVGNGVANDAESQHPRDGPVRICSATGRPLVVSKFDFLVASISSQVRISASEGNLAGSLSNRCPAKSVRNGVANNGESQLPVRIQADPLW